MPEDTGTGVDVSAQTIEEIVSTIMKKRKLEDDVAAVMKRPEPEPTVYGYFCKEPGHKKPACPHRPAVKSKPSGRQQQQLQAEQSPCSLRRYCLL